MSDDEAPPAAEDKKSKKHEDVKEIFKEEEERNRAKTAAQDASWSKEVQTVGAGKAAFRGALVKVHLVGRLGTTTGDVFEDTRAQGEPMMLLLGRNLL